MLYFLSVVVILSLCTSWWQSACHPTPAPSHHHVSALTDSTLSTCRAKCLDPTANASACSWYVPPNSDTDLNSRPCHHYAGGVVVSGDIEATRELINEVSMQIFTFLPPKPWVTVRLLDYGKNHDRDNFGHYCERIYLTGLLTDFVNIMHLLNKKQCISLNSKFILAEK